MTFDEIVEFHGHSCPGVAMGYAMTRRALGFLDQSRSEDEELVAIVENNACGVDALQCMSGCTFGKGNLIFRDYGKHAYTLYSRQTREGVRVKLDRGRVPESVREDRQGYIEWLVSDEGQVAVELEEITIDEPEPAQIRDSVRCEICGEEVMETRVRRVGGKTTCIPCAETDA